jgi:hypothetical protein
VEHVPRRRAEEGLRKLSDPIVVRVFLESPGGDARLAIAYGETLEQALEYAVRHAGSEQTWRVRGWNAYTA